MNWTKARLRSEGLLFPLFALLTACQQAQGKTPKFEGPRTVPENSTYVYTAKCAGASWTVTAPGTPATGTGATFRVTWDRGPAQATVTCQCGNDSPFPDTVQVVQVAVGPTPIALGGKAANGGVDASGLQLVTTSGPPPALTIKADVTLTGHAAKWDGTLEVGFVQRLLSADSPSWSGTTRTSSTASP